MERAEENDGETEKEVRRLGQVKKCSTIISLGQWEQEKGPKRFRMRYEWVKRVRPILSRDRTDSSRLFGRAEVGQGGGLDLILLFVIARD